MDIVADVLVMKGANNSLEWQLQYSYADTSAMYTTNIDGYHGALAFDLVLIHQQRKDTIRDSWTVQLTTKDKKSLGTMQYSGVRSLQVDPGTYLVELMATDSLQPSRKSKLSFTSTVKPIGNAVSTSTMMFVQATAEGPVPSTVFTRYGASTIPNPRHEIIGENPVLGLYWEVYNAKLNNLDTFVVEMKILDNVRREIVTQYLAGLGSADAVLVTDKIPCYSTASGVYILSARITDKELQRTYATEERRFYILNPEAPPIAEEFVSEDQNFMNSEWSTLISDRLELEMNLAAVIANSGEKSKIESLKDLRAKQRFLYKFWRDRDPDPTTEINERLEDFRNMYKRAQYNMKPATGGEGWSTDRGITLLKYGQPTQVILHNMSIDAKPYEEWFYQSIQGGVYFYFVDTQLNQNHRMVHSTKFGELRDENWFNRWAKAYSPDPNPIRTVGGN